MRVSFLTGGLDNLMTYDELVTEVFDLLGQPNSAANKVLVAATVQADLLRAERWLATEARLYRRTATLAAVNAQADYLLPYDLFDVLEVRYSSVRMPLTWTDTAEMENDIDATWRTATAGTPTRWLILDGRTVSLWSPPKVTTATSFYAEGFIVPFSVGAGISTIARVSGVITITTTAAHNLRVGETVTVQRCGTAGLNVALTVATVTSTTSFTATHAGSNESDNDGYLIYTGGVLPLTATTDVPAFNPAYHELLALRAAWTLGRLRLADDMRVQALLPGIGDELKGLLTELKGINV